MKHLIRTSLVLASLTVPNIAFAQDALETRRSDASVQAGGQGEVFRGERVQIHDQRNLPPGTFYPNAQPVIPGPQPGQVQPGSVTLEPPQSEARYKDRDIDDDDRRARIGPDRYDRDTYYAARAYDRPQVRIYADTVVYRRGKNSDE